MRGTRDTGDVGSMGKSTRLGHTESKSECARARESDHHGLEAPFPPSRMPASIELSTKLFVCLHNTTQQQAIYPSQLMVDIHWGKDFEGEDEKIFSPA